MNNLQVEIGVTETWPKMRNFKSETKYFSSSKILNINLLLHKC
jgi:hypothetical protein